MKSPIPTNRNKIVFEGVEYSPYALVVKLVQTKPSDASVFNQPRIIPLLNEKRKLLEVITVHAKEFFDLIKDEAPDGRLSWTANSNLLAFLLSAQRQIKSIKPFGKTKSSIELQRIVVAMHRLRDSALTQLEPLKQPAPLYGRKLVSSHRGRPYLERAEAYIRLLYLARASLDLEIASQYKKCDRTKLLELVFNLKNAYAGIVIESKKFLFVPVPVLASVSDADKFDADEKEETSHSDDSEFETAGSTSSVPRSSSEPVDEALEHIERDVPRSTSRAQRSSVLISSVSGNLTEDAVPDNAVDDKPSVILAKQYIPVPDHDVALADELAFKNRPRVLADEDAFKERLKVFKANVEESTKDNTKVDFNVLRKLIKAMKRDQSGHIKLEMLVRGQLRLAPVSSRSVDFGSNFDYEAESLLAFLCEKDNLVKLSAFYGVYCILRLIKALPSLARTELTERCCDTEDDLGKQFKTMDNDTFSEIKEIFLSSMLSFNKAQPFSLAWNALSLFSKENCPALYPNKEIETPKKPSGALSWFRK